MSSRSSKLDWALAVGILAILYSGGSWAANISWKAAAASTTWSTGTNWVGNAAPGASDIAVFDSATYTNQPNLTGAQSVAGIQVTINSGQAVTISGGANVLTIGASGIDMTAAGNDLSVTCAVSLGGVQTWDVQTGRTLTVGTNAVTNGANNLTVQGAGNTTISGVLGSGAGTLTKNGTGSLTLSAANTFTAGVTLSAGTLNINNAAALGTTAGTFTISGGTIENTSATAITTSDYPQAWNGDFAFTGTKDLNLGAGAVTPNASRQVTVNGGTLTVGGIIGGSISLTKAGAGTLALSNQASTYSGQTIINAGTVSVTKLANSSSNSSLGAPTTNPNSLILLGSASAATLSHIGVSTSSTNRAITIGAGGGTIRSTNATLNLNGTITIGGTSGNIIFDTNTATGNITVSSLIGPSSGTGGTLTKVGVATLILSHANTFTAGTTLTAGVLQATDPAAMGTTAGTLSLNGGILDLATDGSVDTYNTIVGGNVEIDTNTASLAGGITHTLGTLNIGANTLTVSAGVNVTSVTATPGLIFGATTLTAASPTFTINNPVGGGTTTLTLGAVTNGANTATLDGTGSFAQAGIWGNGSGGITLAATYSGRATLSQANTFTGPVTINTTSGGVVTLGNATGLGPAASAVLTFGVGSNGKLNLNGNSATLFQLSTSSTTAVVQSNFGPGGTDTLTINDSNVGDTLTYSGILQDGANGTKLALSRNGASTLIVNGSSNTFTGGTTLTAGTLQLGDPNALGTTAGAGTLTLNGGTLDLATDASVSAYNTVVGGNAAIASDKFTASSAGITHTLGTLSIGANTLTVAGGNKVNSATAGLTFGATTLTAGPLTFTITNPTNGGTTLLTVGPVTNANHTATLNGNGNFAQTAAWGNGSGGITLAGTVTATLDQTNTYSGTTTLSGGTLIINNIAALGTGTFTISGAATIDSTSGGITLNTIPQNWNANFAFTGTTSLNLGAGAVTLGATPIVTVNANTLTVGGAIGGSHGLTKAGPGTLVLDGVNTYNGTTNVSGGTLGGTGTLAGPVTVANTPTISPGDPTGSIGTLTCSNNVTLGAGTTYEVQLLGPTTADLLQHTSGNNTYNLGGATLTITAATSALTNSYTIVSLNKQSTLSGDFNLLPDGTQFNALGRRFQINYTRSGNNPRTVKLQDVASPGSIWNGLGGTSFWMDGANWQGGVAPTPGSDLTFPPAALQPLNINNFPPGTIFNSIKFTGPGYQLSGNPVMLSGGVNALNNHVAGPNIVNLDVVFTNAGTITCWPGGTLNLTGGTVDDGGFDITVNSDGSTSISGTIQGLGGLVKQGAGVLALSGGNTFSGVLSVLNGTLATGTVNNDSQAGPLGQSSNSVVLGNTGGVTGTLEYAGASAISTKTFTMGSGGTGAFQIDAVGTNLVLNGLLDGTGSMSKTGAGTLTMGYPNSYSGGTALDTGTLGFEVSSDAGPTYGPVGSGTLTIAGGTTVQSVATPRSAANAVAVNGNFTVSGSQDLLLSGAMNLGGAPRTITVSNSALTTFSGIISNGALRKDGAGTLLLSAASTYSGGTTLSLGTLQCGFNTAGGPPPTSGPIGTGGLTVNAGVFDLNTFGITVPSLDGAGGTITDNSAGAATTTLTVFQGSTTAFAGVIQNGGAKTVALVKSGTGTLTLSGPNTYGAGISAGTLLSNGTLQVGVGNSSALGNGGLTINAGTLDLNGVTINALPSLAGAGGFITDNSAGAGTTNLTVNQTGLNQNFGGVIQDGAAKTLSLTKQGPATLMLSAHNTYGGPTGVSAGVLANGIGNALPTGTTLTVDGTGTFDLGGWNQEVAGLADGGFNTGTVTDSDGAATFTVNNAAANSFSGLISGTNLSLTKKGVGTLTLSGANTYSGGTALNAGTIICAIGTAGGPPPTSGPIGAGALAMGGGTFDLNNQTITVPSLGGASGTITDNSGAAGTTTFTVYQDTNTTNYGGVIQNGGAQTVALVKSGGAGTGTLTLSGTNTYTGQTTISNGTLGATTLANYGAGCSLGQGTAGTPILLGSNGSAGTLSYSGGLVSIDRLITVANGGSGTVQNSGSAPLTLNGVISIGGITVGSVLTIDTKNSDVAVTSQISGTGGLTKITNPGTLTLSNTTNNYNGDTTISAGTLVLGADAVLPDFGSGSTGNVIVNGTLDMAGHNDTLNGLSGTGTVDNSVAGGPFTLTVGNNNASSTFSGVIKNTAVTLALTKTGTGTLTLNGGASTYIGATAIQDGTVVVTGGDDRLPIPTTVTLGNGTTSGVLQLGHATMGASNQHLVVLLTSGTGTSNAVVGGNAAVSTLTLNIGANATFGGILGGSSGNQNRLGLTKTGGNTLVLTNANNTFNGPTTINGGILQVDGTDANSAVTVSSGCTLAGSGTVGSVTIASGQSGTVSPGPSASATAVLNTGAVQLSSSAFLVVNLTGNDAVAGAQDKLNVAGTINLGSSTLTLTLNNGTPAVGDVYTIISSSGARSGTFTNYADQARIPIGGRTLLIDYQTNLVRLIDITGAPFAWLGQGADNNWATKENWFLDINGDGILNGLDTAGVGPIAGENDNLVFGSGATAQKGTGNNNFPSGTGFNSLTFMDTGYLITGSQIALGAGGITATAAAGTNTLNTPLSFAATQTITTNAGTLTLGGVISETAASGLIKNANGALTLSGANSFSGGVTLSVGTLNINSASALGTIAGTFIINGGTTIDNTNGGITTNAYVQTWSGDFTFTGSNSLNLGTGAVTMSASRQVTTNGSGVLTVGGPIGEAAVGLTLTKAGGSTLTLGGNNTFTGGVAINAGVLQLNNAGALNSTTPNSVTFGSNVPAGTKLQLNGNSVSVPGLATNATPGSPVVENANAAGATLTVNLGSDNTYAGLLQDGAGGGALALLKTGAGGFTLTADNTYSGLTTVNGGNLTVQGQQSSSNAVVNSNAMLAVGQAGSTGDVKVNAGGTLSGSGHVGAITAAGAVNPGVPGSAGTGGTGIIGTLTCASADFSSGGTLLIRIPGSSSADKLEVTGALTAGGTSQLVADLNGYQTTDHSADPAAIHFGTLTGQFQGNPFTNPPPGTNVLNNSSGKSIFTDYSFAPNPNSVTIHVNTPPKITSAVAQVDPIGFDFPQSFVLQVQDADGNPLQYYWEFGDLNPTVTSGTTLPADPFHSTSYTPQAITADQSSIGDNATEQHSYSSGYAFLYPFLPDGTLTLTVRVTVNDGHGGYDSAVMTFTLVNPLGNGRNVGEDFNVTNPANGIAIASKGNGNIIKFDILQVADIKSAKDILQLPPKYPAFKPALRLTDPLNPEPRQHITTVLTGIGVNGPIAKGEQVPRVGTDNSSLFANFPSAGIFLLTVVDGLPDSPALTQPGPVDQQLLANQLDAWANGNKVLARKMINIDTAELTKGNRLNKTVNVKDSFITGRFTFPAAKNDLVTFKGTFPLPAVTSNGNTFTAGAPVKLQIGIGNVIGVATLHLSGSPNGVLSSNAKDRFDAIYNAQGKSVGGGAGNKIRFKFYPKKDVYTIDPTNASVVPTEGQAVLELQMSFAGMSAGGFDTEGIIGSSAAAQTGSARTVYDSNLQFYQVKPRGSTADVTLGPVFPTPEVAAGVAVGVRTPLISLYFDPTGKYTTLPPGFKGFKPLPLAGTFKEYTALDLLTGATIPVVDPQTGNPTGQNILRPQTTGFSSLLASELEPVAIQFNLIIGDSNDPAKVSFASLIRAGYIQKGQGGRIIGHSTSRTSR